MASLPYNWSVFNGHEALPWHISRAEAAAARTRRALRGAAINEATGALRAGQRLRRCDTRTPAAATSTSAKPFGSGTALGVKLKSSIA